MTAQPPPVPTAPSELGRLGGVFFSPVSTFADVARRPRWWIPMILLSIVTVATLVSYGRHVGWERVTRQAIERSANTQNLSAAQREQTIAAATRVAQYAAYIGVFGPAITMVIMAAVLIFLTDSLMGANIGFNRMMGIVGYSALPGVLYAILTIVVMFLKSPEDFDIQNPLAFNAAAFLADGSARWLVSLCSSLDLFSFWRIGLLAAGISVAAPKISFGKAVAMIAFPWALYVVVKTVAAAAFG